MKKTIRVNQTISDIVQKYPEVIQIMQQLGFTDIVKPMMLKTAGKYMTLEKGARLKKKNIEDIKKRFEEGGFSFE